MKAVKVVKLRGNSKANNKSFKRLKSGDSKKLKQAQVLPIQRFNYHDLDDFHQHLQLQRLWECWGVINASKTFKEEQAKDRMMQDDSERMSKWDRRQMSIKAGRSHTKRSESRRHVSSSLDPIHPISAAGGNWADRRLGRGTDEWCPSGRVVCGQFLYVSVMNYLRHWCALSWLSGQVCSVRSHRW